MSLKQVLHDNIKDGIMKIINCYLSDMSSEIERNEYKEYKSNIESLIIEASKKGKSSIFIDIDDEKSKKFLKILVQWLASEQLHWNISDENPNTIFIDFGYSV